MLLLQAGVERLQVDDPLPDLLGHLLVAEGEEHAAHPQRGQAGQVDEEVAVEMKVMGQSLHDHRDGAGAGRVFPVAPGHTGAESQHPGQ